MVGVLRRWWVQVLLVFIASRVVTTTIMLIYAANQVASPWAPAHPDLISYSSYWDAEWYLRIVVYGYPSELPLNDDGLVTENAWAFMPAYAYLVAGISWLSSLPFQTVAVLVSFAFAAGVAFVYYRLFVEWLPHRGALAGVALMLFNPVSPILQVGYAESMHLFLLGIALLQLVHRRYLVLLPVIVLMSFTRPTGLAFALALAGHFGVRWWQHHKGRDPFPRGDVVKVIVAGLTSAVCGFGWAAIAGIATGRVDAYVATELAWRRGYLGEGELFPFTPWFEGAAWWSSWWGWPAWLGIAGLLVILALVALALCSPWMRRLGVDLRIWVAAWIVYLLAVFFPQSSTWRLLLPASPALAALAVPRSKWIVPVGLLLGVVGQWFWFAGMWAWVRGDWTPP